MAKECTPPLDFESISFRNDEDTGKKQSVDSMELSPAQKLKVFMKISKSDFKRKKQVRDEFEELVASIIEIQDKTKEAFKGANTIGGELFIKSLIQGSDITSSISTDLKTSSLAIIRQIIEAENKNPDLEKNNIA